MLFFFDPFTHTLPQIKLFLFFLSRFFTFFFFVEPFFLRFPFFISLPLFASFVDFFFFLLEPSTQRRTKKKKKKKNRKKKHDLSRLFFSPSGGEKPKTLHRNDDSNQKEFLFSFLFRNLPLSLKGVLPPTKNDGEKRGIPELISSLFFFVHPHSFFSPLFLVCSCGLVGFTKKKIIKKNDGGKKKWALGIKNQHQKKKKKHRMSKGGKLRKNKRVWERWGFGG
jgi:hypothetical protein